MKWQNFLHFSQKKMLIYSKFCYTILYFFVPKALRIIFTPKNTPSKSKNWKLDKIPIFFGTPCSYDFFLCLRVSLVWFSLCEASSSTCSFKSPLDLSSLRSAITTLDQPDKRTESVLLSCLLLIRQFNIRPQQWYPNSDSHELAWLRNSSLFYL